MTPSEQSDSRGDYGPMGHACPKCNAAPGEPCTNRTRSYRRGQPLRRPHPQRIAWTKAIEGHTLMSQSRKKPIVIEARQVPTVWTESSTSLVRWCGGYLSSDAHLVIPTLEGDMRADAGDWIIRGVKGEFYPCKPDIFEATYEAVPR